jgi:aspartate aminotransferase
MTGWRIGYGIGPAALIAGMIRLQSHTTSGACCIAQSALWATLRQSEKAKAHTQAMRMLFQERRDVFFEGLKGFSENIMPGGAFYLFADVKSIMDARGMASDLQLASILLEETHVSSVPGTEFGLPGYLRFSYALEIPLLETASTRLRLWAQS